MGPRSRVVFLMGLAAVSGGLMAATASASKPKTSVSLQFASPGTFGGRLTSSRASCVRSRVVHLQAQQGRGWVSVATTRSNRSGHFTGAFHGGAGGRYRALAAAKASCAAGTSKTLAAPVGTGGSGSGTPTGGGGTSTPTGGSGPTQPACTLPLTHDTYDGFHIAVPSGWELSSLGGELEVAKDAVGSEGVVVLPAAQTAGLTPASYFQSALSTFESQAAAEGHTITVTGTGSQNGIPSVTFTAPINGQTVTGGATMLVEPLAGQASSTELVFLADWAPSAAYGAESSLLSSVASCYGPEKASLYRIYQDQAFTYLLPPGWTVPSGGEGPNNINLVDASGDVVAYQFTSSQNIPFNSPQTLIDAFLGAANVTAVNKLWSVSPAGQSVEYEEFTGTFNGQAVHGLVYGESTGAAPLYTGVVRVGLAPAANWNAVNGALIQMAGGIQHQFTQDIATINQVNRQWQSFSNQVANFDDILNNQQLTLDPTSGIYYDAPYDSYDSQGPKGPGYYYGDNLLNIINR